MSSKETPITTSSPPVVHAAPVTTTTGGTVLHGYQQEGHTVKQGHSFLGCCCDMRRAVIIINCVSIVLAILFLILLGVGVEYVRRVDDETTDGIEDQLTPAVVGASIAISIVAMVCNMIGIYGALKFKMWAVIFALVWYGVDLILNIMRFNIFGIILSVILYMYPHGMLLQEMRSGIMTKETYPIEQQSCCCV